MTTTDPYELGGLAWFTDKTEHDLPADLNVEDAERWLAGWRESQAVFDRTPGTVADFELGEPVG